MSPDTLATFFKFDLKTTLPVSVNDAPSQAFWTWNERPRPQLKHYRGTLATVLQLDWKLLTIMW